MTDVQIGLTALASYFVPLVVMVFYLRLRVAAGNPMEFDGQDFLPYMAAFLWPIVFPVWLIWVVVIKTVFVRLPEYLVEYADKIEEAKAQLERERATKQPPQPDMGPHRTPPKPCEKCGRVLP